MQAELGMRREFGCFRWCFGVQCLGYFEKCRFVTK